jgi:amino acid adenylation domain-containing protein
VSIDELIEEVRQLGIELVAEGEQLRVRGPRNAITPRLFEELREHKRALLARLAPEDAAEEGPPLGGEPEEAPFPLAGIQEAYWMGRTGMFQLGNVTTHAYHEIEGSGLVVEELTRALRQVIRRHGMLRAIILADGTQRILPEVPDYVIVTQDLRGRVEKDVQAALLAYREEMSHQVLPSDRWPLFDIRASLLDEGVVRLHVSLDALIVDAASMFRFFDEWHRFYQSPSLELPPIRLSFRDYLRAEQRLESSEAFEKARAYWLARTDSLPASPPFPIVENATALQRPVFSRRRAELPVDVWSELKARGRERGLTPTGVLLAAFSELLAVWTGRSRFTLNVTLFNRRPVHEDVHQLIGNFTSVVLLEVGRERERTVGERARRVQRQLWDDLEHDAWSGLRVLRELGRRRGGSIGAQMPCVFTSTLGLGPAGQDASSITRFGREVYGISQTPQVWLDHIVMEHDGALLTHWDVVDDLFPPGYVDAMFEAYQRLLCRLALAQAWDVEHLDSVPVAQSLLCAEANKTSAPLSNDVLSERIWRSIQSVSESPAVICPRRTLSYRELGREAQRVGQWLRRSGVERDEPVGIILEKGWEQIVAVVGVLLGGAPYLPIDASLPEARIRQIVAHSGVRRVLTQPSVKGAVTWPSGVDVVALSELEDAALDDAELGAPAPDVKPDDLAYIIYTSGSTGAPKGVMISHRSVVNLLDDVVHRFGVRPEDRLFAVSGLHFDLSVFDVFGALTTGAALVMPEADRAKDPAHWVELVRAHGVTIWNSVPALMGLLADQLAVEGSQRCDSLRMVLLSGDWIPVTLPDRVRAIAPIARVMSLGGPTEITVWNIHFPIEGVDPQWASIPYGKPLRNSTCYVLDERLQPCPLWVPGRIFSGGAGLARGYWKDEAQTRARFSTHPVTAERLYDTGDIGRYLPNGNIEFLGRADFQVKVRGNRIELAEIEGTLERCPGVTAAAVVAEGDLRGDKRLAAFVVRGEPASSIEEGWAEVGAEVLDPLSRSSFKLEQRGLRRADSLEAPLSLPPPSWDEQRRRAYLARTSHRRFASGPVSLEQIGELLRELRSISFPGIPFPKYLYPSAGGLYPVQAYLAIKPERSEGLDGGAYAYDPAEHALREVGGDAFRSGLFGRTYRKMEDEAAFVLVLACQRNAIEPIYPDAAMRFANIEAGHMGQLLMSRAPSVGLGLCPMGNLAGIGNVVEGLAAASDLVPLHAFLGGPLMVGEPWNASDVVVTADAFRESLRESLLRRLPDYMVPSRIVLLDALPLSANGKVDRAALVELASSVALGSEAPSHVAPRNDVERSLVDVWRDLLRLEDVGIHDTFFSLGGDSLLAVKLLARIRAKHGVTLSLRDLLRAPTIAGISSHLEALVATSALGAPATSREIVDF